MCFSYFPHGKCVKSPYSNHVSEILATWKVCSNHRQLQVTMTRSSATSPEISWWSSGWVFSSTWLAVDGLLMFREKNKRIRVKFQPCNWHCFDVYTVYVYDDMYTCTIIFWDAAKHGPVNCMWSFYHLKDWLGYSSRPKVSGFVGGSQNCGSKKICCLAIKIRHFLFGKIWGLWLRRRTHYHLAQLESFTQEESIEPPVRTRSGEVLLHCLNASWHLEQLVGIWHKLLGQLAAKKCWVFEMTFLLEWHPFGRNYTSSG